MLLQLPQLLWNQGEAWSLLNVPLGGSRLLPLSPHQAGEVTNPVSHPCWASQTPVPPLLLQGARVPIPGDILGDRAGVLSALLPRKAPVLLLVTHNSSSHGKDCPCQFHAHPSAATVPNPTLHTWIISALISLWCCSRGGSRALPSADRAGGKQHQGGGSPLTARASTTLELPPSHRAFSQHKGRGFATTD